MGRTKGSGTTGSLEQGDVKVVYRQGEEALDEPAKMLAGLRFKSCGQYVSFYASREGIEALRSQLDAALKVLKK